MIDTPDGLREIAVALEAPLVDRKTPGTASSPMRTPASTSALAEIVVGEDARLVGRTLRGVAIRGGVRRRGRGRVPPNDLELRQAADIRADPLQAGDVLLVQGREDRIAKMRGPAGPDADRLQSPDPPRTPKAPWALGIMAGVVIAGGNQVPADPYRGTAGRDRDAGHRLRADSRVSAARSASRSCCWWPPAWRLARAWSSTGAADWIASGLAFAIQRLPAAGKLAAFITFAALLTNFVSNSAAAAIGTPIAMSMAQQLGAPAEPYVLAILFGANLSFATPMAYQTNLLIMSAGGYPFRDFLRVGTAAGGADGDHAIHPPRATLRPLKAVRIRQPPRGSMPT